MRKDWKNWVSSSLEKGKLRGDLIAALQCSKGVYKEDLLQ